MSVGFLSVIVTVSMLAPPPSDTGIGVGNRQMLARDLPYVYGGPPAPLDPHPDSNAERTRSPIQRIRLSIDENTLPQKSKEGPVAPKDKEDKLKSNAVLQGVDAEKQNAVKQAFLHAWRAYDARCFGQDELYPLTQFCNNWMGAGLTLVDSLDTLYVMGLKQEFEKAKEWVRTSLKFDYGNHVSVFETTIRLVGGLNTAFDLTGDRMFLGKSKELADKLLYAFATPTGLPRSEVNLRSGNSRSAGWLGGAVVLSEVGTVQMEFAYLSKHVGDNKYRDKAERVIETLSKAPHNNGLFPIFISPDTGHFTTSKVTFGAMGDSFYEYLLKMWLLTGSQQGTLYQRLYREAMQGMIERMIDRYQQDTYVADFDGHRKEAKMDHLACFVPGMLALGARSGIVADDVAEQHMQLAKEMMRTCYWMYERQVSGIGPEYVRWTPAMSIGDGAYHLRPETVESLFVLWRTTHNPIYREWGWKIFQAIEKYCKVEAGGYVGLLDVAHPGNGKQQKMESFFLAETLKYLYLLFGSDNDLPLAGQSRNAAGYVFNTECHPVRAWT